MNPTHAYSQAGTYTVTLTVTDDDGAVDSDQLLVAVTGPVASFVVLGAEGVWLKSDTNVYSGDVGANAAGPGPYLSDQSEVVIGERVDFLDPNSRVFGDSVLIRQHAVVYDVYYNEIDGNGTVLSARHTPLALPLIGTLPPVPTVSAGTQNLEVQAYGTLTLAAGNYGALVARRNATITFTGGIYTFSQWNIGEDVKLYFAAPTEIRIAGKLDTNVGTFLGPAPGASSLRARDIQIIVTGQNGNNGSIHADPWAAKFRERNMVIVNVYAPNDALWLKANTKASGAFIARWVTVGERVELRLDSGF